MANKIGPLLKEARTGAKLTQEQLASQLDGISANDISKAERGEKELSQSVLKQIAKLTGVTQASLVNAAKESTYSEKTAEKKDTKAKSTEKKAASSAKKTETKKDDFVLTAAEKKLVELYRTADAETKKAAVKVLKGEQEPGIADMLGALLGGEKDGKTGKTAKGGAEEILGALLGGAKDGKTGKTGKKDSDDLLGTILGSAVDLLGKK